MGAGNPLLRSYDNELYEPTTYYIDFTQDLEIEEVEDEQYEGSLEELKSLYAQDNCEWFRELDFLEIPFTIPDNRSPSELSAAFRECGYILAEFELSLLVSTSDSEIHHYAIGMVPNFKYDDIYDEMNDLYKNSESWYEARGRSFDEAIGNYALSMYKRRLRAFKKEAKIVMNKIFSSYGDRMNVRAGAWTCGSITNKHKFV